MLPPQLNSQLPHPLRDVRAGTPWCFLFPAPRLQSHTSLGVDRRAAAFVAVGRICFTPTMLSWRFFRTFVLHWHHWAPSCSRSHRVTPAGACPPTNPVQGGGPWALAPCRWSAAWRRRCPRQRRRTRSGGPTSERRAAEARSAQRLGGLPRS